MENVVFYGQAEIEDLIVEYFVISEPLCAERTDILRYGIMIRENLGFQFLNELIIKDLFFDKKEAEKFMNILVRYKIKIDNAVDFLLGYISRELRY